MVEEGAGWQTATFGEPLGDVFSIDCDGLCSCSSFPCIYTPVNDAINNITLEGMANNRYNWTITCNNSLDVATDHSWFVSNE